jgi:hypothetical protein
MSGGPLKAADWGYWSQIGATELWKAVALSFDVDPDALTLPFGQVDQIVFSSIAEPDLQKFQKRLRIAESQLGEELEVVAVVEKDGRRFTSLVRLRDFAIWAMNKKLSPLRFPTELVKRKKQPVRKERLEFPGFRGQ